MKLVVDSNVLFTFFWKNSVAQKLFADQDLELCSPEFALEEINKYRDEIMKKTKITLNEFKSLRKELAIFVEFIPINEYTEYLPRALKISPDPNDVDFFSLALKMQLPLWSNDHELKNQRTIKILSTKEVIELLDVEKATD